MSASATQGGHKKKPQDENIMACPIAYHGGHNQPILERGNDILTCYEKSAWAKS